MNGVERQDLEDDPDDQRAHFDAATRDAAVPRRLERPGREAGCESPEDDEAEASSGPS